MKPTIYAELLRSLGQVTILIELFTPANSSTSIELQQSGNVLSLKHGDFTVSLKLPAAVKPNSPAQLIIPSGNSEWSQRLSLLDSAVVHEEQGNHVPWSAPQLCKASTCFQCASCKHEIITPGSIKVWKDLPSHNWADMMDFWHCHKPPDKDAANVKEKRTHGDGRGIGGYVAQNGVGLVDLTYILVNKRNCSGGSRVTPKTERGDEAPTTADLQPILCLNCRCQLGSGEVGQTSEHGEEEGQETWKLNKWNLALSGGTDRLITYSAECFLSAQLMSVIDEQAVRRFRLLTESDYEERGKNASVGLRLWVFHIDRPYSSTATTTPQEPIRAMKIYYLLNAQPEDPPPGGLEEEIVISNECMAIVIGTLERSTLALPTSMRRFRSWNAGMLPRFAPDA